MKKESAKTIYHVFKTLYNNGNLVELVIDYERIKHLDEIYKQNYNKFKSFEEFEQSFPLEFDDFKKSLTAYQEIKKQFGNKKGLQPCILTECFVAQTMANHLRLNKYIDLDDEKEVVPQQLVGTVYAAQGYSDGSKFRYCYYNDKYDALVFQCGASGTVDIVFTKYRVSIRIEVKEQVARLGDSDITGAYNEEGKLLIDNRFNEKKEKYIPYIELFNEKTNVFEMEGHNFKISDYLDSSTTKSIIDETLNAKVIDLFVLVCGNKLVPVVSDYLFDFVTFKGSEIRTAGKNSRTIFTPNFAISKIKFLGGNVVNGKVNLPYDEKNKVIGRTLNHATRYAIGSLLFVSLDDTEILEDNIYFDFNKIRQKTPNISLHLNCFVNQKSLEIQKKQLEELIRNRK